MSSHAPRVQLEGVSHLFGKVQALRDVDLEVSDGEFLTLLGPSGCGKTTLLRVVAGFLRPTSGRVLLSGGDVTSTPAHKRRVNMVFQRPTLFPHLNVFDNLAFGLRIAKVPEDEVGGRVRHVLELVRLEGYEHRKNYELSGGQMQRVALARALVNRPEVLLLDEPLSALDLKIRLEMEAELRRVHRETGSTFVYVTHDQREALALSDRIAVFNHGWIEQIGPPKDVYASPSSAFVGRFVGDANLLPVEVIRRGSDFQVRLGATEVPARANGIDPGPAWLVLRPEVIHLERAQSSESTALLGSVTDISFRGTGNTYRVAVDGIREEIKVELAGENQCDLGDTVALTWSEEAPSVLRRDDEKTEQ